MIGGLTFTIGSFFFLILLFLVYFSKEKINDLRCQLYRYLLGIILLCIITEIVSTLSIYYVSNDTLNIILLRIHWFTGYLWFWILSYYSLVFIDNLKIFKIKEIITYNIVTKIFTILSLLSFVIYFLLPFDPIDKNYISYKPGIASYFMFIMFCVFLIITFIYLLFKWKTANTGAKFSIIVVMIGTMLLLIFQFLFPYIAFSPFAGTIQLYIYYHFIENPDLSIIDDLNKTTDEIEKSSKAKTDFLSNVSHEIITPMNIISSYSSALSNIEEFDEDKIKKDMKIIDDAGNSLIDIIKNILDISKLESGMDELDINNYSLKKLLNEINNSISPECNLKNIEFVMDVDTNLPDKLSGDKSKLYQILSNLLNNSVKFTDFGRIKLVVKGDVEEDYLTLHFKVSDTGSGIKEEDFGKLFEKFTRLENATSRDIDGSGLGLVITKNYVDLLGGKIWFNSEYEAGTNFFVDLKQRIVDTNPIGSLEENKEEKIRKIDCSNYTALIVDDNKLNIKVATRVLSLFNFKIDSVTSGIECINKIKEGNKYDIIFMDHMMPEMDGIETLHVMQKLEDYTMPPVIVTTANAVFGAEEMYLSEGFDYYLAKPIKSEELQKVINKYFDK